MGELARPDQVPVLAGNTDGGAARVVDRGHDLFVDRPGKHHFDDLDGPLVGDPQPVDELALDFQLLEHAADLRAAAMDDHRIDADLFQKNDIAGELLGKPGIAHCMPAIFDHERLAAEFLKIGQRFGKCFSGAYQGFDLGKVFGLVFLGVCHHVLSGCALWICSLARGTVRINDRV